ncbi:hypothetical protein ACLQ2N_20790 [Streptomyces sp. DT224]|uniref:hypothetical protein n=1 Tax=Streptomyces sp. DT224 TaxID=3393426 RepID=UPI003CF0E109
MPDETAAAVMTQGLTANRFTTETYAVGPGDTAVVHAAVSARHRGLRDRAGLGGRAGRRRRTAGPPAERAGRRVRHMQSIGETDAGRDADRSAAALPAGIRGGVVILLSTGSPAHPEAALDQGHHRSAQPKRKAVSGDSC